GCVQSSAPVETSNTDGEVQALNETLEQPNSDQSNIPTFNAAPSEQLPDGFAAKFRNCEAAILESTLVPGLTYSYEILGLASNLCSVKSKFLANPNPDFVGPEMTCSYDNSQDFQTAVQDTSNCQGELYQLMTGG
ncbi:MAG: hypothetical protein Q8R15_04535, partial [Candidatus Micrarchaeota archaeon]|nr:hypothetical protein [Candidatus Micrarchaeota archaeon]